MTEITMMDLEGELSKSQLAKRIPCFTGYFCQAGNDKGIFWGERNSIWCLPASTMAITTTSLANMNAETPKH